MEAKFKTSFIPKQALQASASPSPKRGRGVGMRFGSLISLIVFLATVGLSAGLFLYEKYLTESIATKKETLERARDAFKPALIRELTRLDTRIKSAKAIIDGHSSPSAIFSVLEQVTLENVRYDSFSYTLDGNIASISMGGLAKDFEAVALQSDAYGANKYLSEQVVSDLDVDDSGYVSFNFAASIDPQVVSFVRNLPVFEALKKGEPLPSSLIEGTTTNTDDPALIDDAELGNLNLDGLGI